MMKYKIITAFTIVELLIVIVVIGILAATTIAAYNGIQERARMAAAKSFGSQLKKKYMVNATGMWNFDECSGSSVNNGVSVADAVIGTATWITDTPSGSGGALRFNGTTRIETTSSLGATAYVESAWVRIPVSGGNCNNVIPQAATNGVQAAFYLSGCKVTSGHNGSWNMVQSPQTVNDGKWHHTAIEWESGTLKAYLDGQLVASTPNVAVPTNATGFVSIGSHTGGNYIIGDIDEPFVAAL
jgi:Tfp pilus assembly protein PilE